MEGENRERDESEDIATNLETLRRGAERSGAKQRLELASGYFRV